VADSLCLAVVLELLALVMLVVMVLVLLGNDGRRRGSGGVCVVWSEVVVQGSCPWCGRL
jgi:hypothetical protein